MRHMNEAFDHFSTRLPLYLSSRTLHHKNFGTWDQQQSQHCWQFLKKPHLRVCRKVKQVGKKDGYKTDKTSNLRMVGLPKLPTSMPFGI